MNDREIFAEAVTLGVVERAEFLARACAGDQAQRARIEALLAAHAVATGFLERPAAPGLLAGTIEIKSGDLIGPYTLRQKLGEGGCGVVWMAEQEQPLRRRVALKVIKLGMDTKEVIARFEAERQALALMDHPNIAKVFDAGATQSGRPYFVMELVRGVPMTKYCDELALPTTARLELFVQVCQAIQHAHQKGVIHRDLKPSNILVTLTDAGPVPKVIDFGIAKATQGRLADQTIYTSFEQFIGTPAYISPEQAELSGLDIDTRSDIYSLGVLLYELLTGRTPFDPKELVQAGLDEMRRRIREIEPQRPSTRLSTLQGETLALIARHRHAAPPELLHQVRGDLDWIVMRCLEKDRTRRYAAASALGDDVLRHLHDEPVAARPPSRVYRFRKLVRRNRVAFAAAAAVLAALVIGILSATAEAIRATRAERAAMSAEREQSRLRQFAEKAQATEAAARARAEAERQRADAGELAAQRRAYSADMQFLQLVLSWSDQNYARALLNQHRPGSGSEPDFRDWEWRYWWQHLASDATGTFADNRGIARFAVSPDGRWVAGLRPQARRGDLVVWNVQTRRQSTLEPDAIVDIPSETDLPFAFAPGTPVLAVAISKGKDAGIQRFLRLWNVASGQQRDWPFEGQSCGRVQFSPDGEEVMAWIRLPQKGTRLVVWRVGSGEKLRDIPLPAGRWLAVDRQWLHAALCPYGGPRLRLIEISSGRELWSEEANYVLALNFSPDGEILAWSDFRDHGVIRLRNTRTGRELGELRGHMAVVTDVVFWPDGRTIASCSEDQTIRLWDTKTCELKRTLFGAMSGAGQNRLALLADGKTLLSRDAIGRLALWDTGTPNRTRGYVKLGVRFACWQFGPDSNSVLTVDEFGVVTRWHGRDWRESDVRLSLGHVVSGWDSDCVVEVSAEPPLVAIVRPRGIVEVWDWEQRAMVSTIDTSAAQAVIAGFIDCGRKLLLKRFAGAGPEFELSEWDIVGGKQGRSWGTYRGGGAISVSQDERHVLLTSTGHWSWLDRIGGIERKTVWPVGLRNAMNRGSISPDGRLLALPGQQAQIEVFDQQTLAPVRTLKGAVQAVTFSPNGRRLAVMSALQQSVVLYEVDGWQRVLTLGTDNVRIAFPRFSPDGNVFGVMSLLAGNLFLWRAPTQAEIEAAEAKEKPAVSSPAPATATGDEDQS